MNIKDILYTAISGDKHEQIMEVTKADLDQADIVQISEDTVHLIDGHQSHLVQLVHADYTAKQFVLRIDGKDINVKLRDEVESRIHAMGFDIGRNHVKLRQVSAPMPGMVLKVQVHEGDHVKEGQPIIILEAMKMENVLNAPVNGVISKIFVQEKQNVDKNQLLVELG
ncbi:MAG TPA: acetyl-CoA carboxylase biotin carboxyl carrier protein subunit [Saprospiraceae bacterium]|nr:acetyl-CoA carboxylase biotin carboxyl carrier protein subunit [Saprospiraceae bacterium]